MQKIAKLTTASLLFIVYMVSMFNLHGVEAQSTQQTGGEISSNVIQRFQKQVGSDQTTSQIAPSAFSLISPAPIATFTSPAADTVTDVHRQDFAIDIDPNGQTGTYYVFYTIGNNDQYSQYSEIFSSKRTVTLNGTDPVSISFNNFPLLYQGDNYISCFIINEAGTKGNFCGGEVTPNMLHIQYTGDLTPLYRFWSDTKQAHFYTASHNERLTVEQKYSDKVWRLEGIAYFVGRPGNCGAKGMSPVYRFWSDKNQRHFYTISENEKNTVISKYPDYVWKYEREAFCAEKTAGTETSPVFRFWSDTLQGHFYTINEGEKNAIEAKYPKEVWAYERVAYHAYK